MIKKSFFLVLPYCIGMTLVSFIGFRPKGDNVLLVFLLYMAVGIPFNLAIAFPIALAAHYLLGKTPWGRKRLRELDRYL